MLKPKMIFFIYNFVIRYFLVLPVLVYNIALIYNAHNPWIPHIFLVALLLLVMLRFLSQEKFNAEFFKSPVNACWNRQLPFAKKLLAEQFVFDEKDISKADLYIVSGMLVIGTILMTVISIGASIQHNLSISLQVLFIPILFLFGFGGLFFFISYLPAWKLSKKSTNVNLQKPYWYWFSYNTHYNRQHYFFRKKVSDVVKNSTAQTAFILILSGILLIDWIFGSSIFTHYPLRHSENIDSSVFGLKFLEFNLFYFTLGEGIKYFYVDKIRFDSKN